LFDDGYYVEIVYVFCICVVGFVVYDV
jgi:hypothetical protein